MSKRLQLFLSIAVLLFWGYCLYSSLIVLRIQLFVVLSGISYATLCYIKRRRKLKLKLGKIKSK